MRTFPSPLTLTGVEDGKDVVGRDLHWAVGEESKAPAQSQNAAQAHDGQSIWGSRSFHWTGDGGGFTSEQPEPAQHHHEGEEGEEEDGRVVADVYYIVHGWIYDPAPDKSNKFIIWELSQCSALQQNLCGPYREIQ